MKRNMMLSICDLTGVMAQPWLDAGYEAILIDPQHGEGIHQEGNVTKIGYVVDAPATWNILREVLGRVAFVAAFPVCTDLAVSGARWFTAKEQADANFQHKAMQLVWHCHAIAELSGAKWMLENPVSRIASFWRKPDHYFHPHQYTGYCADDNYTKKTALWTGGGVYFSTPVHRRNIRRARQPDTHGAALGGASQF